MDETLEWIPWGKTAKELHEEIGEPWLMQVQMQHRDSDEGDLITTTVTKGEHFLATWGAFTRSKFDRLASKGNALRFEYGDTVHYYRILFQEEPK